jgi:capsular exopolysaccharide synthesis family protein
MHPDNKIADQFRNIRSNIQYASEGRTIRSIVVTSPEGGDGKTTVAVNLAISLVQQGDKVLLIDTNFRKPALYDVFNLKNLPGLTNVLAGQILLRECIHKTEIGRLEFMTSGPILHHSAEMLGSPAMKELLESAYKIYDKVILDVPAVLDSADAKMLASFCDGSLLIIRGGKTKDKSVIEAKRLLDMARVHVMGAIINEA